MNLLRMICDKLALICRYCTEGDSGRAMSGMADVNEPLLNVLGVIFEYKKINPKLYVDEAALIGSLQLGLDAMQGSNTEGLRSALYDGMLPELERIYKDGGAGLSEMIKIRTGDVKPSDIALSDTRQAVCMFGYGDGALYEELSSRAAEGSTFIVYEPERDSIVELREQLQDNVDYYLLENLLVFAHPGYDSLFATEYADFMRAVNDNRDRLLVNRNTLKRFKEDAPRNVITNLGMVRSANMVSDLSKVVPKEVPVIIVAAGPSLDKNIELLRRAKGHALIFAVDTAMKYLMERDIMPDLAITIEPIKPIANYEDERCFDIPQVFDCESNPQIVSRERGRCFVYNCRDYVKKLLESIGITVVQDVASGGSVATAAFAICYQLQMRTVIMIGQDLAYAGTATHAGGVESAGINGDIGYTMVDGIDGNEVRTRSDWIGYLRWFENGIGTIREQHLDMEVIDATEGGALIHGSRVMTLSDAIDKYCNGVTYDFSEALKRLPTMLDEATVADFDEAVERSFEELTSVKDYAHRAVMLCDEAVSRKKGGPEVIRELNGYRASCEKALLYPLINNYSVTDIADEVSRLRVDASEAFSEIKQMRLAFEAIEKACDYFAGLR